MEIVLVAVAIVILIAGVEWATRSAPQPVRWGLLALVVLGALVWLFNVLGVW